MTSMMTRRIAAALMFGVTMAAATPAFADKAAEDYVAKNAPMALAALNAKGQSPTERQVAFGKLFDQFADLPRIADFVLGRYARTARADPALYAEWIAAYRDYSIAVYQDQLDQYRGNTIRILPGSKDATINGRFYSVVRSEILRPGQKPLQVQWRLLRGTDGAFRVVDVAVQFDENIVWLAIQQQADNLAFLDRNKGDVRALLADVKRQTATMRARIAAGQSGRGSGG
ncbi:MAG: ABC transporter substrate-binding protein [Alphaproteobacteria bacterium]|nr:ABC transporter substrate-binding protein [Alphaproteobacteria bacterium]